MAHCQRCATFSSRLRSESVCVYIRTNGEPTLETAAAAVGYAVWWAAASSGRPALRATRETILFAGDCFGTGWRGFAQTKAVCVRVSAVTVRQRRCRPTEPTRTRRVRLRVGRKQTHAQTHP